MSTQIVFDFDKSELSSAVLLLQELIAIPSFSREEGACADHLQHHIESLGYTVNRTGNNIWLMAPGFSETKPTLLLCAHIDTVKPGGQWSTDPFTPTLREGKIYGLGANDDGASVVAMLEAYFQLNKHQQPYNLIYAAVAEEEVSGKEGIEALLRVIPKVDFAIVGEPTNMQLAVAEKGLMVLDVIATGRAGHAARNEGENAIYKALKEIEWFRDYRFGKLSGLLGEVTMRVTQIQAGTQHNVIPDKCTFVVDIRTNECYSNREVLEEIKRYATCQVQERSTRLNSTATPLQHPLVEKAFTMGAQPFGSPTLSDQALMSFPSVKIGPGDSARSHTANEYIEISEIGEAIDFYVKWLNQTPFV